MSEVTTPGTMPEPLPVEEEEGERYDGGEIPDNGEGDGNDESE